MKKLNVVKQKVRMHEQLRRTVTKFGIAIVALIALRAMPASAQYFQSNRAERQIVKASGLDSTIVDRLTPFAVPAVPDSVEFTYHEPMPDSIMPRTAVVIGRIHLQAEYPEDITQRLEKYARQNGADWIVSYQEPRARLNKDHMKVYTADALLLHVLDAQFIQQQDVATLYYENSHLQNYAAVNSYFDTYGRHMGLNEPKPTDPEPTEADRNNPDK